MKSTPLSTLPMPQRNMSQTVFSSVNSFFDRRQDIEPLCRELLNANEATPEAVEHSRKLITDDYRYDDGDE